MVTIGAFQAYGQIDILTEAAWVGWPCGGWGLMAAAAKTIARQLTASAM